MTPVKNAGRRNSKGLLHPWALLLLFSVLLVGPSTAPRRWHRHRRDKAPQMLGIRFDSDRNERSFGDQRATGRGRRPNAVFPTLSTPVDFQFTSPHYNLSVYENSIGPRAVASNAGSEQMVGVWLPRGYNQISFRIVEGDKQGRFAVSAKRLGNFAFLQIEHKDQMDVLNRELQSEFAFTVRAVAKRKKANAMEASTTVHLRVLDENDNLPMFKELSYRVEVDVETPPNTRILRLEAFDADEGLNGDLVYSLVSPSDHFYIEPSTGWLRTFAPLRDFSAQLPANTTLDVRIEDRASRLFERQGDREDTGAPSALFFIRKRAAVEVLVQRRHRKGPALQFHPIPLSPVISESANVGTLRVLEDGEATPPAVPGQIYHLELARQNQPNVSQCAWLERLSNTANEFALWICPPFPVADYGETLPVRIAISRTLDKLSGRRIWEGEETVELSMDPAARSLWMEEVRESIQIDDWLPAGAVVWQFGAGASWPGDVDRIKFKLQTHAYGAEFPFELDRRSGEMHLGRPLLHSKVREWDIAVLAELEEVAADERRSLRIQSAPTQVKISVRSANSHCPEFVDLPPDLAIRLLETHIQPRTPSDAIVWRPKVIDGDGSGENGQTIYKLLDEHEMFSIDAQNGELRLTGTWPSGRREVDIRVMALDGGWPLPLQTQIQLSIQNHTSAKTSKKRMTQSVCGQANGHSPVLVLEKDGLIGEVQETAPIGTTVGSVKALDADRIGPNGFVHYWTGTGGDHSSFFGVDRFSGRVFVRKALTELVQAEARRRKDRQDHLDCDMEVGASDAALPVPSRKNTKRTFRVRIRGANAHSPAFAQPGYRIRLAEGNSPGLELLQLRAADVDLGKNGKVEFRLAVETDLISVDPDSGRVKAERSLDREELGDRFSVLVMALDRGQPSRVAFANLTIQLDDINDQTPRCAHNGTRQFTIPEDAPNGQLIGCIGAFDADAAGTPNSEVQFELVGDGGPQLPFRVHPNSGCIFLKSDTPLDFEQRPLYDLAVKLRDRGSPPLESAEPCRVQVLLEDVDENVFPPLFADSALEASVEENSPAGTEVLRVHAEDPEGEPVRYRLVGGSGLGWFSLDPHSGMIRTTKELDYELHQQFWLTVRAEDDDRSRQLRSHLHVLVRVLNQNDRVPLFSTPLYEAAIAENSPENKVVLKVEATDADDAWASSKQLQNGERIKYSIVRGNPQSHFQIDENTGYIVSGKRRLDREAQSEHELQVRACDQEGLCSTATVLLAVEDLNDNAPVFDTVQMAALAIPADRKGLAARIFAADADSSGPNSNLRYWMEPGPVQEQLYIDTIGRVFSKVPLKAGTELEAVVWAEDAGTPPQRTNASIRVPVLGRAGRLRVSNRAPNLLQREEWAEMDVSESDPVGRVLGIVQAQDPDGDPLWWTVAESSGQNGRNDTWSDTERLFCFRPVANGAELVLADKLQAPENNGTPRQWTVHFSLSDGVDTIHDQLVVRFRPSSAKRRPQFEQPKADVELSGQFPAGYVLHQARVLASHSNSDQSIHTLSHPQRLQFALHSVEDVGAEEVFRVDPSSGNVLLEKSLPERLDAPFSVTISASLSGSAEFAGFATLRMRRKAVNEHSPEFTKFDANEEQIVKLESVPTVGDRLYSFEAFDPDAGDFGRVTFSIVSGNEQRLFSLDANTGELRLAKEVPRNLGQVHLGIRAADSAPDRPKWSKCQLRVVFSGQTAKSAEREDLSLSLAPAGPRMALLAQLPPNGAHLALDNQSAECSRLLAIHFANGQIALAADVLAQQNSLNCTVLVQRPSRTGDGNELQLTRVPLRLLVLPASGTPPRFSAQHFHGQITENAPSDSPVISSRNDSALHLALSDEVPLTGVKFRLLCPLDDHFAVDVQTGLVRGLAPLDRQIASEWTFFALAQLPTMQGAPLYSRPVPIHIAVLAQNNTVPRFGQTKAQLHLLLPSIQGAPIGWIPRAKNTNDSTVLKYSIQPGSSGEEDMFAVDPNSRMAKTAKNDTQILATKKTKFGLEVTASDGHHTSEPLSVQVNVLNSTESHLQFPRPIYEFHIRENRSERILLVSLWPTGAELGESIRFELLPVSDGDWTGALETDEQDGLVWLDTRATALDREAAPRVEFVLRAYGQEGLGAAPGIAQSLVVVHLEDANDCAPEFGQSEYAACISEAARPGDRLLTVRARDNDTGMNAAVRYTLEESAPKFVELNKYDGKLTVSARIGEHELAIGHSFEFGVRATDRGVPPLSSTATVQLRVVHRLQPIFSQPLYTTVLSRIAPNESLVAVRAGSGAEGARMGYRIVGGDEMRRFRMDFEKGHLFLKGQFEPSELEPVYNLSVEATDITRRDAPPGRTQVRLDLQLAERRVQPQFGPTIQEWTAPENAPVGTLLGKVATPVDNGTFSFVLDSTHNNNNTRVPIAVEPQSGAVRLVAPLDFERCQSTEVRVQIRNGRTGEAVDETVVRLRVQDVNDNAPAFVGAGPLEVKIWWPGARPAEEQFLHKFEATDSDTPASGLQFDLVGDRPKFVRLDGAALFTNWAALDETEDPAQLWPWDRPLNVSVGDGLHRSFASVVLALVGALPSARLQFEQPLYSTRVAQHSPVGSSLGTVQAKAGSPPYKYAIGAEIGENSTKWPITVEERSGRVVLTGPLLGQPVPWLAVPVPLAVRDSQGQTAFTLLHVRPLTESAPENMHPPHWIAPQEGYRFALDAGATQPDEPLLQVLAVDPDQADRLEYQIAGSAEAEALFQLNSTSGVLSMRKSAGETPLDSELTFAIRVSDTSNPPHRSEVSVHARLLAASKGAPPFSRVPHFSQLHHFFAVAEDASPGHTIGRLQILGTADGVLGEKVRFSILRGGYSDDDADSFPFALDELSGELSLKRKLNAESRLVHHFVVRCSRGEDPAAQLSSLSLVSVAVMDVNDAAPEFLSAPPKGPISAREDAPPGTVLAAFVAWDPDVADSALSYSLEAEREGDVDAQVDLTVDPEQGWLQVGPGGLDRERRASYRLRIVATDSGGKKAEQAVQVDVLDVNDSAPRFEKAVYEVRLEVDESSRAESPLLTFNVTDPDKQSTQRPAKVVMLDDDPLGALRVENMSLLLLRIPSPSELPSLLAFDIRLVAFDGVHSSSALLKVELAPAWAATQTRLDCGPQELQIAGNLPAGHPIFEWPRETGVELLGREGAFRVRHSSLLVLPQYHLCQMHTLRALLHRKNNESTDGGICMNSPAQFGCIQKLLIRVHNANRMAPHFPAPELVLNISEHAFPKEAGNAGGGDRLHVVARLEAFDDDWADFGHLKYSLSAQDRVDPVPFWLDPQTAVLSQVGPLDRESRHSLVLEVRAADGGGLEGRTRVVVNVLDENDNAPECAQPIYQAQLLENDTSGLNVQLEAFDRDATQHPDGLLFSLAPDTPPQLARLLRVSPSGKVQLAPDVTLDFEQWANAQGGRSTATAVIEFKSAQQPLCASKFQLVVPFSVNVHDRGEPLPLKGRCRVQIALLDVNDNAPAFERPVFKAEVDENAPVGTRLVQLVAHDEDSEHFGHLSYTLMSTTLVSTNDSDERHTTTDNGDLHEHFALDAENGWLSVAKPLDHEQVGSGLLVQLRVRASDGGDPPLHAEAQVHLRVRDQNDNAPRIADCGSLSALVQGGVEPGHSLLSLSISDADSSLGHSGPFRVQLSGEGADAFAVDPQLNVITTRQLHFEQRREFQLQVRAFDVGGLASDPCPLRVRVRPQSRHSPTVSALSVQLVALHGEFLGGPIGKVHAEDRDPADLLKFAVASGEQQRFSVHPESGELFAPADLLPGIRRFNVSVTDGKFVAEAPITVEVVKLDQEALDHSLSVRLRGISAQRFVRLHLRRFSELVARLVAVRPANVRILSLQEGRPASSTPSPKTTEKQPTSALKRKRRQHKLPQTERSQSSEAPNRQTANETGLVLDLLLVVQRPDGALGTAYHRPNYVKQRMEAGLAQRMFEKEAPELEISSLTTEVCRRDTCVRGDCRDRLWLDNARLAVIQGDGSGTAFVGPRHVRTFQCICRQGYGGANCDVPLNKCSKELCKRAELCIPSSALHPEDDIGFSCACPPGFRGTACADRICAADSPDECARQNEALSLLGNGYIELRVANSGGASLESRMELSVEFRTVSANAVLMHGKGVHDFHTVRLVGGLVQYEWDCGTGEGLVRVQGHRADDGQWHRLRVLRIGRLSRLTLDDAHRAEAASPPGSDVLNLFSSTNLLVLGARVEPSPAAARQFLDAFNTSATAKLGRGPALTVDEMGVRVLEGMVGCIGRVALDGTELPKTAPGMRLFNADIGCEERAMGPCLSAPCQNGGQCVPSPVSSADLQFTCRCPQRFTGARCEIDLNACAAHPCPNGVPCHNLYGDFHCSCPAGFTGKTCQLRGDWDPCVAASCGPNGQCVRQPNGAAGPSFVCHCLAGFGGPFCSETVPTVYDAGEELPMGDWLREVLGSSHFLILLALCLVSLFLTCLGLLFWRRRSAQRANGSQNRRRKVAKRNGTVGSSAANGAGRNASEAREDSSSRPLVPKQTTAPGQGTADRPPPPLPPRYHKRDANGHSTALPTVEVRPMPISSEQLRQRNGNQRPPNGVSDSSLDCSLKRAENGRPKRGRTETQQQQQQRAPMPPPRHSHCTAEEVLRSYGRPLDQGELRQLNLDGEHCSSGDSPSLPAHNGEQQNSSYGRKIDQACSAAANTQKQKAARAKKREEARQEDSNSDYLTMKPVHRAKPFRLATAEEAKSEESPPPPPRHRTPLVGDRVGDAAKLYDSPNDAG